MKWIALFLLAPLLLHAADNEAAWSKPVKGLRARLFFLPSQEPEFDKTFDVMIELQEVGVETSMGRSHEAITVRFTSEDPPCSITDASGKILSPSVPLDMDYISSQWDLVLPTRGDLTFAIGASGDKRRAPTPGQTQSPGMPLRVGLGQAWLIPPTGGPYYLSGRLSISPHHFAHDPTPCHGWIGELILPPVEIPGK
jgi:hypothetical protein